MRCSKIFWGPAGENSYFGDSHINALKKLDRSLSGQQYNQREQHFISYGNDISVRFFGSASAIGLANPNSVTGVRAAVPDFLKTDLASGVNRFVFHFGKVDLDFVLPFRWLMGGVEIQSFMKKSIRAYSGFISEMKAEHLPSDANITIIGLTPPSLHAREMLPFVRNEAIMKDVLNKAETVGHVAIPSDQMIIEAIGSRAARTELCAAYNNKLRAATEEIGVRFADPTKHLIDQATGELLEEFIFANDHHLNPDRLCHLLYNLGISLRGPPA